LVVGDYILDYELKIDSVEIVAIRHGRQRDLLSESLSQDSGDGLD